MTPVTSIHNLTAGQPALDRDRVKVTFKNKTVSYFIIPPDMLQIHFVAEAEQLAKSRVQSFKHV